MSIYRVRAKRWEHGWELHIDGVGVTQSRTLDGAGRMVRDYIGSLTGRDASGDVVEIRPDLGGLEDKAAAVREWVERAQRESREAAAESRKVARELREAGLSVSDAAAVLGVSRGRISQLGKAQHLSGSARLSSAAWPRPRRIIRQRAQCDFVDRGHDLLLVRDVRGALPVYGQQAPASTGD